MQEENKNSALPVLILTLVIIGATIYFGKFWYDTLFKKDQPEDAAVQSSMTTKQPEITQNISKSEKPTVDLFVMAFCPYGNFAENTMYPVRQLLGDKIEVNLHYVVSVNGDSISSLRGQPEVDQNTREICVGQEYGIDKKWEFIGYVNENCGSDGTCWEEGLTSLGLNVQIINDCVSAQQLELMTLESNKAREFGAQASPTLFVNGTKDNQAVYNYGKPNAYKDLICSAFETAPEECSTVLEDFDSALGPGSCN